MEDRRDVWRPNPGQCVAPRKRQRRGLKQGDGCHQGVVYPPGTLIALRWIRGEATFVHLIPTNGDRSAFHPAVYDQAGPDIPSGKIGRPIHYELRNHYHVGLDTARGPYRLHSQQDSRERFPRVPPAQREGLTGVEEG